VNFNPSQSPSLNKKTAPFWVRLIVFGWQDFGLPNCSANQVNLYNPLLAEDMFETVHRSERDDNWTDRERDVAIPY